MHLSLLGMNHFHCLIGVEMVVSQELLWFFRIGCPLVLHLHPTMLYQTDQWYHHHRWCLSGHFESLIHLFLTCTLIMPPVYTFVNWQRISMGETYFTKLNHLTVFAGQSFQCYCHYISTYTMNSIWLTVTPSAACYPYYTCYLLPLSPPPQKKKKFGKKKICIFVI
jgi:hypothetical protein